MTKVLEIGKNIILPHLCARDTNERALDYGMLTV